MMELNEENLINLDETNFREDVIAKLNFLSSEPEVKKALKNIEHIDFLIQKTRQIGLQSNRFDYISFSIFLDEKSINELDWFLTNASKFDAWGNVISIDNLYMDFLAQKAWQEESVTYEKIRMMAN